MRCGDLVLHCPSGEIWVAAYVDGDWLAWCGWPAGEAPLRDFELYQACDDDEHVRMLRLCAASDGKRARKAQAELAALLADSRSSPFPASKRIAATTP